MSLIDRLHFVSIHSLVEAKPDYKLFQSIRERVWNPVFTTGVCLFIPSMLFRGFLDAQLAAIPLGISTLILFAGVWKLSASGKMILDEKQEKLYLIYKHLGYIQKVKGLPFSVLEKIIYRTQSNELGFLHSNGAFILFSKKGSVEEHRKCMIEISTFLRITAVEA